MIAGDDRAIYRTAIWRSRNPECGACWAPNPKVIVPHGVLMIRAVEWNAPPQNFVVGHRQV